jgi:DoxX-like family
MNNLLWGVQILLAGVFLFTAAGKLFDYQQLVRVIEGRSRGKPIGISRGQAILVGLGEAAGAIGLLIPGRVDPGHRIVFFSAGWLCVLMMGAGLYHLRRRDSATPPVVLFLLTLFLMLGRWRG